ncbi:capsid protein [Lysinibacillus sp. KCTC 33748]|uniref:phage major capsid protein n=1 Tax=unclassified Lysinibacillus TaxID=2636778 RepID=UPI0009A915B6|nr:MULTISPECIES: phage major capsid protein [unclassified Lysinibacillus]OXS66084.1 capsid protein [Lysinibacillus sp. KCTC 33748]SKC18383.1 phage major capsid protein, HK97 family [Lysinibacillus sp. AC-3]
MVIKFNKSEDFKNAKAKLTAVLANEAATQEEQSQAFENYFDVLQSEVTNAVATQVNNEMLDRSVLQQRGQNVLTSEETKFFNAVVTSGGFSDDSILPKTTIERVFEELANEYPLLEALGLQDLGAVTRYIDSDPTKAYAWGNLFEGIAGQVSSAFSDKEVGQLKLTAFAAIPNDMLELGPVWVERYVRTLLVESYSTGLEYGFVNGHGATQKEPIGLMKDVNVSTGAITDKVSSGTLTFAPSEFGEIVAGELHGVISALSVDSKGKKVKVGGKVVMVVNPTDAIAVQFRNTIQTASGQWVTALPYNIQVVESDQIPSKKTLFFVKGRYNARLAGGVKVKKFDQTLAIEDATLYTLKQFANGEPKDNKAALLYDLDIQFNTSVPTP